MKKYILIIALFVTASAAFAIFINEFKSWNELIEQSPDIVIAKCTATLDPMTSKPTAITDGMITSDIEVIKVLKGRVKPGPSHMASQYWPYPGEQFLMFANYEKDQFNTGYTAIEGYRIVSLQRHFNQYVWDHYLAGKPLNEQVQWILNSRLRDLKDEIDRDKKEEARIEMYSTTNAP